MTTKHKYAAWIDILEQEESPYEEAPDGVQDERAPDPTVQACEEINVEVGTELSPIDDTRYSSSRVKLNSRSSGWKSEVLVLRQMVIHPAILDPMTVSCCTVFEQPIYISSVAMHIL